MIAALQTELNDKYAQLLSITLTDEGQPPLEEFTGTLMRPLINLETRKLISGLSQDYQPKENQLLCLSTDQLVEGFNLLTSGQDRYDCIEDYVSLFPEQLGQVMGEIEEIKRQISETQDKEKDKRKGMMASEKTSGNPDLQDKISQILGYAGSTGLSIFTINTRLREGYDYKFQNLDLAQEAITEALQNIGAEKVSEESNEYRLPTKGVY